MKCTNRKIYSKQRRKKRKIKRVLLFLFLAASISILWGYSKKAVKTSSINDETIQFTKTSIQKKLLVDDLCVATEDVTSEHFDTAEDFHAIALMDINEKNVLYAENIHDKLYPASTTKILTLYLALKHGTLTDMVTISEKAVAVPSDSSKAGLLKGDQLTLEALLYSLMLPSGNDSAVAIAEHISGSEEAFVELMNEEAKKLGATNSNFTSPHGYHDENHYTTAYDLYLIFNECIKDETFLKIVSTKEYQTKIKQANGTYRDSVWKQSNQYINGTRTIPDGVTIIGGKTGTTNEAGSCLILYSKSNDLPYISIIMGAETKPILYQTMSNLITSVLESN